MTAPDVRVVCFDLGGVVIRICRTWEEACERAGVDVREPEKFREAELAEQRRLLVEQYQTGALPCEEYWPAIAQATGGLYDADEVRAIHCAWTMDDYPGVAALIDDINVQGAALTACLSNTNPSHWSIMCGGTNEQRRASVAIAALRRRLVSHDLKLAKPDNRIYTAAERELGVSGHQIVFFDDLHENVEAARSCGWRAFQIDHTGDTAAQMRRHLHSLGVGLEPRLSRPAASC